MTSFVRSSSTLPALVAVLGLASIAPAACSSSDEPAATQTAGSASSTTASTSTGGGGSGGAGTGGSGGGGGAVDPGALIKTSMDGTVGVLLDDLPADLRDRAATDVLARDDAFWTERAERQLDLTHFRLLFRYDFYLLNGMIKHQLLLPPKEKWVVTLDTAGAKRTTVDGHDLVTMGYHYESTILSDATTPAESEPALGVIGGTWDEVFDLPIDPEFVFQRTGYACMRETENPPNSVDSENTDFFYDQTCMATASGLLNCHVSVPSAPEDCSVALVNHVGHLDAQMHFERLPWDAKKADDARVGTAPKTSTPDLAVRDDGLTDNRLVYKYIAADSCAIQEGCVGAAGWRRLLEFDADVHNVGGAALDIGSIVGSDYLKHNVFYYSPCHQHYHFRFYGSFDYGSSGDATGSKKAFCLLSTSRYSNDETTPTHTPYEDCTYQGIETGWGDEYYAGLDCQWIDVTGVDTSQGPVTQALAFDSNPDQFLCEGTPKKDKDGNLIWDPTTFTTEDGDPIDKPECDFIANWDANNNGTAMVTLPAAGGMVTSACARGQLGPLRDCGFASLDAGKTCTPGATVHLSCSIADGAKPQLLRLCEASAALGSGVPCGYHDALGAAVIEGAAVAVDVTCPAARDAIETGGKYAVYGAPLFDADGPQAITCTEM